MTIFFVMEISTPEKTIYILRKTNCAHHDNGNSTT